MLAQRLAHLTYKWQFAVVIYLCIRPVAEHVTITMLHLFQPPTPHLTRLPGACVKQCAAWLSMTYTGDPVKGHSAPQSCLSAWKHVMVGQENHTLPRREWSHQFGNESCSSANITPAAITVSKVKGIERYRVGRYTFLPLSQTHWVSHSSHYRRLTECHIPPTTPDSLSVNHANGTPQSFPRALFHCIRSFPDRHRCLRTVEVRWRTRTWDKTAHAVVG